MSRPVRTPLLRTVDASFASRVDRKLRQVVTATEHRLRRLAARTAFSLPLLSRRNPRRHIVRFKDYCQPVESFPRPTSAQPPHWYISIRSPESISLEPPVALDAVQASAFQTGARQHQGGPVLELPEVFLASVSAAKIYSRDFLLLSNDHKIFFESALSRRDYLEANGILDAIRRPKALRLSGEYCLLANRSTRGYYHWLIDVLPKLSLLESFPDLDSVPLILPRDRSRFHRESLELAGIPDTRIFNLDAGCWQADRVYFPEILGPTGIPSPHAVAWLRRRFLGERAAMPATTRRRIYLTRRDATQRRVLNESELTDFLTTLGFEVVCPGDLSFGQQIELFRDVGVVIAPHGAGLTNMVFTSPGATIIEFFGDNYINGCFWALANLCGHRHGFLVGSSTWLDYNIPLADLKALLARVGV